MFGVVSPVRPVWIQTTVLAPALPSSAQIIKSNNHHKRFAGANTGQFQSGTSEKMKILHERKGIIRIENKARER